MAQCACRRSLGVGATGLDLDAGAIAAALLGIALAAGLWWTCFGIVTLYAERDLAAATGAARARLARDAYRGRRLPLVAGIILPAFGMKQTIAHAGDPPAFVPAVAL